MNLYFDKFSIWSSQYRLKTLGIQAEIIFTVIHWTSEGAMS